MRNLFFLYHVLICSNIYLYQYGLLDIYFILWCYNPILLYFIAQIVQALAIGSSFSRLLCPFDTAPSICVLFFWALSYFLALQDASVSSCIFPAPVLESAISPRSPGSFYWKMVLGAKIWVLGIFPATGISFPSSFITIWWLSLSPMLSDWLLKNDDKRQSSVTVAGGTFNSS